MRLLSVLSSIIFGSLLFGCGGASAGPNHDGPLESGGQDHGQVCVPAPHGYVTMGGEVMRNRGSSDIVIDQVDLREAHGLSLVDSLVVPANGNLVGYLTTWPPGDNAVHQPGVQWAARRSAKGATIRPETGDVVHNLVTGIRVTGGSDSSMTGIDIHYHTLNGDHYWARTSIGLVVKVPPAKCF